MSKILVEVDEDAMKKLAENSYRNTVEFTQPT